jgi:aldehyde:ferredoxin oxidoreductase
LTLPLIKETVEAVTGWSTSLYELLELGERSNTMARVFNVREGLTPEDDNLPDRLYEVLEEGTPGEKRISREDVGAALRNYYGAMGWDPQTGVHTEGRLGFLGLEWLC